MTGQGITRTAPGASEPFGAEDTMEKPDGQVSTDEFNVEVEDSGKEVQISDSPDDAKEIVGDCSPSHLTNPAERSVPQDLSSLWSPREGISLRPRANRFHQML
jgi:hypothetical protein